MTICLDRLDEEEEPEAELLNEDREVERPFFEGNVKLGSEDGVNMRCCCGV